MFFSCFLWSKGYSCMKAELRSKEKSMGAFHAVVSLTLWNTDTHTHTQNTQKEKQPAKQANPHVVLALGLQPGPRWWEVSALTAPSLLCYNKTCGLKCLNKTLENSQNNSLYHSGLYLQWNTENANSDDLNSPLTWTKSHFPWILPHFSVIFTWSTWTRITWIPY